jgi:hypothetical protein
VLPGDAMSPPASRSWQPPSKIKNPWTCWMVECCRLTPLPL